jgi:CheY-like chemotaxis protein
MSDQAASANPAVVLVVEDEWLLRELAVEIIEDAGFATLEADNAEEAMALLEARSDIAVIFTDINMPGDVDGVELAHTVCGRWPAIKILVASGRFRLEQSDLPPGSAFLEKPYRAEAVIAQLRSLADPVRTLIGSDFRS